MRLGSSDHPIAVQILKWGGCTEEVWGGWCWKAGGGDADRTCGAGAGKGDLGRGHQRDRERETQGADLFSHSPIHKRELHFESKELGF